MPWAGLLGLLAIVNAAAVVAVPFVLVWLLTVTNPGYAAPTGG